MSQKIISDNSLLNKVDKSNMTFNNKTILVTGGTGSFGQKFAEIVLEEHNPEVIRIFSRGELEQQKMCQQFNNNEKLRFFIGDVRSQQIFGQKSPCHR